jgi:hypothetical protein
MVPALLLLATGLHCITLLCRFRQSDNLQCKQRHFKCTFYANTLIHRYTNTPIHRYTKTPIHQYNNTPPPPQRSCLPTAWRWDGCRPTAGHGPPARISGWQVRQYGHRIRHRITESSIHNIEAEEREAAIFFGGDTSFSSSTSSSSSELGTEWTTKLNMT